MSIITIPREFIKEKELVLIPRRELEELLKLSKKVAGEIKLTPMQKKALESARQNKRKGNVLTLNEFKIKLGLTN